MTKLKEKFNQYKVREWLTIIIGLLICLIQIYRYATNGLLESVTSELIVAAIWLLLITAPKTLNDVIRKARGLDKSNN